MINFFEQRDMHISHLLHDQEKKLKGRRSLTDETTCVHVDWTCPAVDRFSAGHCVREGEIAAGHLDIVRYPTTISGPEYILIKKSV